MKLRSNLIAIALITSANWVCASPDPAQRHFNGYASDLQTDKLVSTEHHREILDRGRGVELETVYREPSGETLAHRTDSESDIGRKVKTHG